MADKQKQLLTKSIGRGQDKEKKGCEDSAGKTDKGRIGGIAAKQRENDQRQSDEVKAENRIYQRGLSDGIFSLAHSGYTEDMSYYKNHHAPSQMYHDLVASFV